MAIKLTFMNAVNVSAQVGDTVYANTADNEVGVIDEIDGSTITIDNTATVTTDDFIMFRKNNSINLSSLKGYFAEATLQNSSPDKRELFVMTTEVGESSK
tara:strand:+ start:510 stop:809 length:300 start_codon:yes stop_codon:yes gene_type:complete